MKRTGNDSEVVFNLFFRRTWLGGHEVDVPLKAIKAVPTAGYDRILLRCFSHRKFRRTTIPRTFRQATCVPRLCTCDVWRVTNTLIVMEHSRNDNHFCHLANKTELSSKSDALNSYCSRNTQFNSSEIVF